MSNSPTNAELEDQLRQNALAPAEASNETGSVKQHSLKDQIELDRHLTQKAAAANPLGSIGIGKFVPGSGC